MISVPFYQLTRHAQAKRLRLSIDTLGNIKVTAPRRVSAIVIDEFVKDNLDWIKSTRLKNRDTRITHPDLGLNLPQKVHLKAMLKTLQISPVVSSKLHSSLVNEILYLYGPTEKDRLIVLRLWIKAQARQYLSKQLALQAEHMELSYNRLFIKNQKTRWGSCSSRKNINLNQIISFSSAL